MKMLNHNYYIQLLTNKMGNIFNCELKDIKYDEHYQEPLGEPDEVHFGWTDVPKYECDFIHTNKNGTKYYLYKANDCKNPVPDSPATDIVYKKIQKNEKILYIKRKENSFLVLTELAIGSKIVSCNKLNSDFKKHSHVVLYIEKTEDDFFKKKIPQEV
jgi:hypothetical protein